MSYAENWQKSLCKKDKCGIGISMAHALKRTCTRKSRMIVCYFKQWGFGLMNEL